ncbi:MAG: A24 family peptidase [archaeon]
MIADIILVTIAVVWVLAACISDIKSKEVPDWLSYSLIALALGVRFIYALTYSQWFFFLYGVAGLVIAFVVGALFYYSHIWGGGDSKLLMGLGAIFATAPFFVTSSIPFFVVILTNILIFGAIYGLIWALVLFVINYKKVLIEAAKVFTETVYLRYILVVCSVIAVAMIPFMDEMLSRIFLVILAVILLLYYVLFIFIRALERTVMYKRLLVSKLVVGDWVAKPVKVGNRIICSERDYGLTQKQIIELKHNGVKYVLIKDGMIFVPAFVFGLIFSLVFGDILFLLF